MAADLPRAMPVKAVAPPPQVWSWSGWYVGVNAGYAWGKSDTDCSFVPGVGSRCSGFAFPSTGPKGALIGGEVGVNWQYQNWVFGLGGDLSWVAIRDTTQFPRVDAAKTDQLSTRYDWLGTARGRIGVAAGPSLFYGTGGAAFARVKHDYVFNVFNQGQLTTLNF